MQLIEAQPLPTPSDGTRLLADLWQLTSGRAIGLYLFGFYGNPVMLGVHCRHPFVEQAAAAMIADQTGSVIESGWAVAEIVEVADDLAVVNMVPTERHLAVSGNTWSWQRTDPLRGVYHALANLPADTVAGVGLTLRALPNLTYVVSLAAFACGEGAGLTCVRIASCYGGIGVRVRRPIRQKRALGKVLSATARRPQSIRRVELVSSYWHPPFIEELPADHPDRRPVQKEPAGYLGQRPVARDEGTAASN